MKKIRSRMTILLMSLVIVTSCAAVVLSWLTRTGRLFNSSGIRAVIFGLPLKDVLIIACSAMIIIIMITLISRTTNSPILELNRATKEIAGGNFDVKVDMKVRVEEFGELQENFNLMAKELRNNECLRKDFISNVSHELKTPLTILGGYADLLAEGGLSEDEQREYARTISAEAKRLIALTGNMLRLSNMEHGDILRKSDTFSLDEQIRRCVLKLEPRWTEKQQELSLELEEVSYTGDEELLFQLWLNLLENAVKYTGEKGSIFVALRREGEKLLLSVRDTGIGMEPETVTRIFEQFYRGSTESQYEGNGLGLPLARRIAELHGGSIAVESEPGRGSTFTVTLPLRGNV